MHDIELSGLTFLALLGMKDMIREQVPYAIERCKNAGVQPIMITGDNKLTAKVTAVECNICEENDLAMEGYQFAELIDDKEKIR